VKRQQDRPEPLNPLVEFIVEDILSVSDDQLLAEAAEDYGSPSALAAEFDSIALPTVSGYNTSAALDPIADFIVEDILSVSDDQLLAEAAEDYGNPIALAAEFDSIALPAMSRHNTSAVTNSPATAHAPQIALAEARLRAFAGPSPTTTSWSFLQAEVAMLSQWLAAPLRGRTALGAFATLLLVAVLTPGIYQLLNERSAERIATSSRDDASPPSPTLSAQQQRAEQKPRLDEQKRQETLAQQQAEQKRVTVLADAADPLQQERTRSGAAEITSLPTSTQPVVVPPRAPPQPPLHPGGANEEMARPEKRLGDTNRPGQISARERPSSDPKERINQFVNSYDGGSCFFVASVAVAEGKATLDGFGSSVGPFEILDYEFKRQNGFEASIGVHQVTASQCGAVSFLSRMRNQRGPAPHLDINTAALRSGGALTGTVADFGNRNVDLLLISDDGFVTNLTYMLKAAGNTKSFSIRMQEINSEPTPQLLFAVASNKPFEALKPSVVTYRLGSADQVFAQLLLEAQSGQSLNVSVQYFKLENKPGKSE
jgi:hypothetical protein